MSEKIKVTIERHTYMCSAPENRIAQVFGTAELVVVENPNIKVARYRAGDTLTDAQTDLLVSSYPNTTINFKKL